MIPSLQHISFHKNRQKVRGGVWILFGNLSDHFQHFFRAVVGYVNGFRYFQFYPSPVRINTLVGTNPR